MIAVRFALVAALASALGYLALAAAPVSREIAPPLPRPPIEEPPEPSPTARLVALELYRRAAAPEVAIADRAPPVRPPEPRATTIGRAAPSAPTAAPRNVRPPSNIGLCERHGMRQVFVDKYRWRCRL